MPHRKQGLDVVFRALSDATRRAVLARLAAGPASTSDLAKPFDMALPSFVQHLAVLEECGLVRSTKRGRVRTYRIVQRHLRAAENWFADRRRVAQRRAA
jgi:DNA-binding transcriptional ArsR family regulator